MRTKRGSTSLKERVALTFAALLATTTLTINNLASAQDQINVIRFRNETTNMLNGLSMMGGAEIMIDGSGFDSDATTHLIKFNSLNTGLTQMTLFGPAPGDDESFSSDSLAGKIGYVTPSVMDIFGVPLEAFSGVSSSIPSGASTSDGPGLAEAIMFTAGVYVTSDKTDIECATAANCRLYYSVHYTPQLHETIPSQVYKEQRVAFAIDTAYATGNNNILNSDMEPMQKMMIGDSNTYWEGIIDASYRPTPYHIKPFRSVVGDQKPGKTTDPRIQFRVGDAMKREESKHCNFVGDECWHVRTHPVIDSIDKADGYTTGSQTLTITGSGFEGTNVVKVDGVTCVVTTASEASITCVTGAAPAISKVGVSQPGSPGMTLTEHDQNGTPNLGSFGSVTRTEVATAMETYHPGGYQIGYKWDGWFKAPETGNYKFYLACDDLCQIRIDSQNAFNAVDPASVTQTPTVVANRAWHTHWRDYYQTPSPTSSSQYQSSWISLTQGQFYKMDAELVEGSGDEHMTASVEFQKASTASHPHSNYEVQKLSINHDAVFEEWQITIVNPDDKELQLTVAYKDSKDPAKMLIEAFDKCKANASAGTWNNRMSTWYRQRWGTTVTVTKTNYDASDVETAVSADIVKSVINVKVNRLISEASFTQASLANNNSAATITITAPSAATLSSTPLSGKFVIECPDVDGTVYAMAPKPYNTGVDYLRIASIEYFPHLKWKTDVQNSYTHTYRENGVEFLMIFKGYKGDVPECTIKSDVSDPIVGSANIVFNTETIRTHGTNLFFEPIPLEMMYTDEQKPQVTVETNGLPAICRNKAACDYAYIAATSQVTAQTLSGLDLTITGTTLPTSNFVVNFALTSCTPASIVASSTQITCTLAKAPTAGDWHVKVIDGKGLVPYEPSLTKINVPLIVNSISPNKQFNQLGGDVIQVSGSGFNPDLTQNTVIFSDTTDCNPVSVTETTFDCEINGFDQNNIINQYDTKVKVTGDDGIAVEQAGPIIIVDPQKFEGYSVVPASVSPVLKQNLVVTLKSDFPGVINSKDDFTAKLVSAIDKTVTYPLYVVSVEAATKKVTVKYPGAPSGDYFVQVTHVTSIGRIDSAPLGIKSEGVVTAIDQSGGSILGGQFVTITGINFSNDPLDNPVKVGTHYCLVKQTSPTQITCQIARTGTSATSPNIDTQTIVFLRTSEEAVVQAGVSNTYQYRAPIAALTAMSNSFDTATNKQTITLTGTGFIAGNNDNVKFFIDDVLQTTTLVTSTTATIEISDMTSNKSTNLSVVMPDGFPSNFEAQFMQEMTVNPALVSVSPSVGSAGGSLLTVTGVGFGLNTKAMGLYHVESTQDICREVTIVEYGKFTCLTKAQVVVNTDQLQIMIGDQKYGCVNTVTSECQVSLETTNQPTVTAFAKTSDTQVTFTGTNFPTSGSTGNAYFKGFKTETVTINSATEAVATWAEGVPTSELAAKPELSFVTSPSVVNFAINDPLAGDGLINAIGSLTSPTGLSCSFAGGCEYEITGPGVTASLRAPQTDIEKNRVEFCGQECITDFTKSDSTKAVCKIPSMPTSFSSNNLSIVEGHSIVNEGVWSGTSAQSELAKLIDGKDTTFLSDNTSENCHWQIAFPTNYVGVLDKIEYFMLDLANNSMFINGNVVIQGSNDAGVTWTDLATLDANLHSGWNSNIFGDSGKPGFNIYRWQGKVQGSCKVGEVRLVGTVVVNDANSQYQCTPQIFIDGQSTDLNPVTFDEALTPVLSGMDKRFGSVLGGDTVTFTGSNFSATGNASVLIDNRECVIDSQTSTSVTCTTSDKPFVPGNPTLEITFSDKGSVATKGLIFRYVSRWSDAQTWNNDLPPLEGEAINIPAGMHLLVDVDSTPKLSFVVVEGSLIFAPHASDENHQRTFDAMYVMVRNGYFEAGTEQFPYTSKLTITMHSNVRDPYLPIYGNKVIGVRFGTIDLHGKPRLKVWTSLETTAEAGSPTITLQDPVDWKVGEKIVIASTDYSSRNSEERTIASIANESTKPLITLDQPITNKHYAGVYSAGGESIEMRAEVGLLSRNLKFQGDPQTSATNQYGAHIMVHSPGDESSVGRIENAEFYNCGQAFKLGRYPIHFHMIGNVAKSYIKNNSIHQTYNRAVTIHGVHYLKIQGNFAYKNMGHAVFIEDAAETNCLIEDNLVMDTRRSWSLLNTDQTPASFWITNPNNIFRRNHAAGSDRYSYWYDTQITSIGPSFDPNICPENTKIGEFIDNVAHSNGRYGLRLFHNLIPRQFPCQSFTYSGNANDPYPTNPPIQANFRNLISYKNGRNGAIAELVGAVQWHNFKTADNILAGMEYSMVTGQMIDGYAMIQGGVVFGKTDNADSKLLAASPRGVITVRTENFTVENTKFINFDFNNAAALGDCSHCFHGAATDSGARTYTVKGLKFDDATVPRRIRHQLPWRGIWKDLDGSLTGLGPNTWAAAYHKHLEQPECQFDQLTRDKYEAVLCDSTVQIRRIVWYSYAPGHFRGMPLRILPEFEYENVQAKKADGSYQDWVDNKANYGLVDWKSKANPSDAWAHPLVTGHRYRMHWGNGLDFNRFNFDLSERWEQNDKNILINMNFTETREAINVTMRTGARTQSMEGTINELYVKNFINAPETMETGDNYLMNDTDIREFEFAINGRNPDKRLMKLEGLKCISGVCDLGEVIEVPLDPNIRLWSNLASWDWNGGRTALPDVGEDIEIPSGINMVLDIPETPVLKRLEINGRLTFKEDMDINLQAKLIWVRAGELFIGNSTNPYTMNGKVTLHGDADDETLVVSPSTSAYNKVLANTGKIEIHGVERSRMSRLQLSAKKGDTTLYLEPGLDWQAGDKIYLAPTAMRHLDSDYATLVSYDIGSGLTDIDTPLEYYHFGTGSTTVPDYGVDMRGEVVLLNRNVQIVGTLDDDWGCQVFTTDIIDGLSFRSGKTTIKNAEVFRGGQRDTFRAAIRFENSFTGLGLIENVVAHGSSAWNLNIDNSSGQIITNFSAIGSKTVGISIDRVRDVTVKGAMVFDVPQRDTFKDIQGKATDKESCFMICTYSNVAGVPCPGISVTDSIAAGCHYAGFQSPGNKCDDDTQTKFRNNVAHSVLGSGHVIYPDPTDGTQTKCFEGSHIQAYKVTQAGIEGQFNTDEYRMTNVRLVDNQLGLSLQTGGANKDNRKVRVTNSVIYGESNDIAQDCPESPHPCYCPEKGGFMLAGSNFGAKPPMIVMKSALPMHKVKSEAAMAGIAEIDNVEFKNFKAQTLCGGKQTVFFRNKGSSDGISVHKITNTKFTDVDTDGFFYMKKADAGWANISDCGEWPCTAPANALLKFKGTSFVGTTPSFTDRDFNIVPKNEGVTEKYAGCTEIASWRGSICKNQDLAMLFFESLDADSYDRSVQPVVITSEETGYSNKLNSMMDHVWDGFYTGQTRRSSFSAQIEAGKDYQLEYTGTPPGSVRYRLEHDETKGIKVRIYYPNAGSYQVLINGAVQKETGWDTELGRNAPLPKQRCGENRFVGIENFLEFFIMPNCEITVQPLDAIKTKVRMQWTLAEFYANGGVTRFADRVAAALGIDAGRIKTVAVYEGSVIVDFFIDAIMSEPEPIKQLEKIKKDLVDIISTGVASLGAPLLGIMGDDQLLAGTPIPPPGGADSAIGADSSAIVKDDKNLWDEIIEENEETQAQNAEIEAKQNEKITKTITRYIENSRFKETPVRSIVLVAVAIVLVLVGITIYMLCKCLGRKQEVNQVQDDVKKLSLRRASTKLDPQFWLDDSKAYLGNPEIIGLGTHTHHNSRPSSTQHGQERESTSRGMNSTKQNEQDDLVREVSAGVAQQPNVGIQEEQQ